MLTYGWVRSTYAVLRNLTEHKLNISVGDVSKIGMCQCSRYVVFPFDYPNPLRNEKQFIDTLVSHVDKLKVKVLIPSHDETGIIVKNKHAFPSSCLLPVPSLEQLELANDKSDSQKFAQRYNIPTANRIQYNSVEELHDLLDKRGQSNLVVRLRKGNSAKGVFYPADNSDCITIVNRLMKKYNLTSQRLPVIQEYVHGEGWGVSCLYWNGERVAHFTHRRLREKTETGGTSTLREHQPNDYLEAMAFTLLDKMKWHGLAMVEFKYDSRNRVGWFIEINPRLWGSIHLAISAGVEFPWLLYLCATEGVEAAKNYHKNKKIKYPWRSRWYLGDYIVALNKMCRGEVLSALKLIMPGNTDAYDDIHKDDLYAFIGEAGYYLFNFIKYRSINPVSESIIG